MARPCNDDVFRAIAHPGRRSILQLLRKRDLTPGEMLQSVAMSNATLSSHLRVLRTTNLIVQRRVGRGVYYGLHKRALRIVQQWAARF